MSEQHLKLYDNESPADTGVGINKRNRLQPLPLERPIQRLKSQQSQINSTIGIGLKPLRKIPKGYQIASYPRAIQYLHSMSYSRKFIDVHGEEDYQPYQSCVDTNQLKKYGLGVYLYLQFVKRLAITLLIMSCINMVPILYAYYNGTGLSTYSSSYMITMAKTTLGNISNGTRTDYLCFTVCDILSMIVFFVFYLHWRSFHHSAIEQEQKDHQIVNPSTYAVSIVGFSPQTNNLQQNLKNYMDNMFKGCYQVQVVYNYNGNFKKFIEYDELIQQAEKQRQVVYQTGKKNDELLQIQEKLNVCEQQISHISQAFEPQYAIIHFRTLKAKNAYINFCRRYALVNKFTYSIKRCCTTPPSERNLFMGKNSLLIQSTNLSRPQQINWDNLDISGCSKLIRVILSIIFLIISIIITSSLIALCTLYVSSTSSCSNYNSSTLLTAAIASGGQTLYCYCATHFSQIYSDPTTSVACQSLSNTILYSNLMQAGASLVSAISNTLLIVIVSVIAKHLLKPETKPKQFLFIFLGVLISNFINSTALPLIMNGNIFGFQSLTYLKFIKFIDFQKVAIFKDFDIDWYAVVAPYYMTFLIIASFSPIINLFVYYISNCYMHWKVKKACQNNDKQNPVIQKEANLWISGLYFDLPTEQALICLYMLITIMYSSFIPLLLPIMTIGMILNFICKKQVILRYSIRIPANEYLSQKTMNIMPFIIVIHFIMGVWSHTAQGVFASGAYIVQLSQHIFNGQMDRIFNDIVMLGGAAFIVVWILFDYTMVSFCNCLHEICMKDDLELPVQFAAIENQNYANRLKRVNITGSYKLINHPVFGHALKAYKQLKHRLKKRINSKEKMKDSLNPQM